MEYPISFKEILKDLDKDEKYKNIMVNIDEGEEDFMIAISNYYNWDFIDNILSKFREKSQELIDDLKEHIHYLFDYFPAEEKYIDNLLFFGLGIEFCIHNEVYFYTDLSKYFRNEPGLTSYFHYIYKEGDTMNLTILNPDVWILNLRYDDIYNFEELNKVLNSWKKNKPKKYVLDDLKYCLNRTDIIKDFLTLFDTEECNRYGFDPFEVLNNLIYFGATVGKNLLEYFKTDYELYNEIRNLLTEAEILSISINNGNLNFFSRALDEASYQLFSNVNTEDLEKKEEINEILKGAHYGQKIARYIKNAMNDEFEMKPFRTRIDERNLRESLKIEL
jgi:hypothetical protein